MHPLRCLTVCAVWLQELLAVLRSLWNVLEVYARGEYISRDVKEAASTAAPASTSSQPGAEVVGHDEAYEVAGVLQLLVGAVAFYSVSCKEAKAGRAL